MQPLILASTSTYRQTLIQKLGIPFQAISPPFSETSIAGESPTERALRLAVGKARSLADEYPNHLIIGSDQVAFLAPDRILSKPGSHAVASEQLLACSGRTVHFYTGLCLLNTQTNQCQAMVEEFRVRFRTLTKSEIERYLVREQPYDCAGSFKCEGLGISLFEAMEGRDFNGLIGLPLILLCELLRKEGIQIP